MRLALFGILALVIIAVEGDASEDTAASFPGHNGRIIFETFVDGADHFYAANSDGSQFVDFGTESGSEPAWSPDGSRIAFIRYLGEEFQDDIFVMNADGSGENRLTSNGAFDNSPAWTPDGRILFASDRDGDYKIYRMDSDGSNVVQLTDGSSEDGSPDASPDGKQIAFARNSQDGSEIWVMGANGESPTPVTNMSGFTSAPDWSPDGSKVAFYSNDSGNFDVYSIEPGGSDLARLTDDPERDASPAWSPDGSAIAFMSRRDNPPGCDDCEDAIFLMNADGSNERLFMHEGDASGPDWQALGASGDTDCDEDVDAVDGLFNLRYTAGLAHPSCVFAVGDVDCDGDIDAVDALLILRHIASLAVNLPGGCREIGA